MERVHCPICRRRLPVERLVSRASIPRPLLELIEHNYPDGAPEHGICERCLKDLYRLAAKLEQYSSVFVNGKYGIIPTPVRLSTNERYTGRGVTIAFLDAGYYLHPDLVQPKTSDKDLFNEITEPRVDAWHGMMTSVVAAGNGYLSGGIYRSIAYEANVVLIKVGSAQRIYHDDIRRGIEWVIKFKEELGIRVLNISCGGDYEASYLTDPLAQAAEAAVRAGIVVVAAAGNKGDEPRHPVIPPANAPSVITVGGLDDNNQLNWSGFSMYRSSYGPTIDGLQKPELIAPSIWLAAPILPGSQVADQAQLLETLAATPVEDVQRVLREHAGVEPALDALIDRPSQDILKGVQELKRGNNVITAHYKHVDGTSFAAPIVSSIVAQMIQANPQLAPQQVKRALIDTARRLPRYSVDKQGWGVINPRQAVDSVLSLAQPNASSDRVIA